LDEKLAAIEQNKINLIAVVKQTSAKLKFTLNGSVARDLEYLTSSLQSSQQRLTSLDCALTDALHVLTASTSDCPQINVWLSVFFHWSATHCLSTDCWPSLPQIQTSVL